MREIIRMKFFLFVENSAHTLTHTHTHLIPRDALISGAEQSREDQSRCGCRLERVG